MEILLGIAAVLILVFLWMKKNSLNIKNNNNQIKSERNSKGYNKVSKRASLIQPIRKGYQIYFQNMSVEGIKFQKDDANNFLEDTNLTLTLEADPNNIADENAIRVIGEGNQGTYFLGYVPKEIALKISKTDCLPYIYARLIKTYRSERNFIDVTFQIIGQKDKKEQFDSYEKNLPITSNQKEYLKFWNISYDKDVTTFDAQKLINDSYEVFIVNEPEKMIEWARIESIRDAYEKFGDKDEREQFIIKKRPTKKQIESAVDAVLQDGLSLEAMEEDYDLLVDKLTNLFPELWG